MQVGILDVKCCPAPEARGGGRVCEKGRDVYVLRESMPATPELVLDVARS